MDRAIAGLAVVLLCGGSLVCSVLLWANEQQVFYLMLLASIFATGLELAKFVCFVASKHADTSVKRLGYFALGSVLLIVSVFASVAFFEAGTSADVDDEKRSSQEYQQKVQQLNFINEQIALVQVLVKKDAANNYRARSYQQLEQLNDLYDRNNQLSSEVNQFVAPGGC